MDSGFSADFVSFCMAPAFDSTVPLPVFPVPGAVIAAPAAEEFPGGKGLNVARWLAVRGRRAALGGLVGMDDRDAFEREMSIRGVFDAMVRVPGGVRRNELFATPGGDFKVNRPAYPALRDCDWEIGDVCDRALGGTGTPRAAVLTGSLPKAVPSGFYADAAALCARRGCAVALDASGKALEKGIEAAPDIVKPNRDEAAELLGFALDTREKVERGLRTLLGKAALVVLSDGAAGCWFASREGGPGGGEFIRHVPSPSVRAVDPTGAGDTMLAEFLHCRYPEGGPDPQPGSPPSEESMRRAVAAGAAAATTCGATPPDPALVDSLASLQA